MIIPDKFKVAGFEVTVDLVDKTDDNNYGYWDDVTNTIVVSKNISLKNGELTALSKRQMENTFYHELYHAFQFYSGKEYSEVECNIFANFMLEFNETKQVKA
jgi:hypothetical protein